MFGSPSREPTVVNTVATAGNFLTTSSSFLATSKESFKGIGIGIEDDESAKAAADKDEFPNLSFCPICPSCPACPPGCPSPPCTPCARSPGTLGRGAV